MVSRFVQVVSPAGMECSQSSDDKTVCKFAPEFVDKFKASVGTGLKFKLPEGATPFAPKSEAGPLSGATLGDAPVCEDMADFIPTGCNCTDTSDGGTAMCVVDMNGLDTIFFEVDMNVCAQPLEIAFYMYDYATGLTFSYSITTGDTGEVPTGISVGVPGVGDAMIYLTYELSGNLDALEMKFGFDLGLTVLGYTSYCSDYYPEQCPLIFLDETIDFGDACSSAKVA